MVVLLKPRYHGVTVPLSSSDPTKAGDVAGMGVVHSGCPEQGQALLLLWQQSSRFPAFSALVSYTTREFRVLCNLED